MNNQGDTHVYIGHPLMAECDKFLMRHKPKSQREWLQELLNMQEIDFPIDYFGSGSVVQLLESKMAELLGKESALFVHKGMVGQLCALKRWSEISSEQLGLQSRTVALHPQSHVQCDESLAYEQLLGLSPHFMGARGRAIAAADISALPETLAAVSVELPVRHAGFQLPEWGVLQELRAHCDKNKVALHLDGARLLESSHYWQKSYADVAALGDSVYVSLYKMLGAMAGGVIAGSREFIDSLRPWKSRFGGDINTVFPIVLSALSGLETHIPRVAEYCQRAKQLSALIKQSFGEEAVPQEVQTNGFVVHFPVAADKLSRAAISFAEQQKVWLFDRILAGDNETCRIEFQVGNALDDWSDRDVVDLLKQVVALASR